MKVYISKQIIFKMKQKTSKIKIGIIGTGNLGLAIIKGLLASPINHKLTMMASKRKPFATPPLESSNLTFTTDNVKTARQSDVIILSVQPNQFSNVIAQIKPYIGDKVVISTITGMTVKNLEAALGKGCKIVRAMPNTAIAVSESMTCLSTNGDTRGLEIAQNIFNNLGKTLIIEDKLMQAATVLGASGIAFWLRLIRATTQGGVQMGFDAEEAKFIAVQTSLGAANILAANPQSHPEGEIDKVTTPKGCTIRGLNQMEQQGLSSALIHGLLSSYEMITDIKKNID